METMLRYELKKVLGRRSSQIALLLLLVLLGVTVSFALDVKYVNDEGESEKGPQAAAALKAAQKAWAGPLDEAKIRAVLAENQRIQNSPLGQSEVLRDQEIVYGQKQGFMEIRDLINHAFAPDFQNYDYFLADRLSPEVAPGFDANRVLLLQAFLEDPEAQARLSPAKRAFLVEQYQTLETPMEYDYMVGWNQLFEFAPTVEMITALILGYLVAGIFSSEFAWKSDAIFFSSLHGRDRAVRAKVLAGVGLVTVLYFAVFLLYSLLVLGYLGFDGAQCPIQAWDSGWKCFYHITIGQLYLLVGLGGCIGCLFLCLVTMLVSARTRSTAAAVTLPFLLLFLPVLCSGIARHRVISQFLALLPDRTLELSNAVRNFDLFEIGGQIVGAVPLVLLLYGGLAVVLVPVLYQFYRRRTAG